MKKNFKKKLVVELKSNGINLNTNNVVNNSHHKVAVAIGYTRNGNPCMSTSFVFNRSIFEETLDAFKEKLTDVFSYRNILLNIFQDEQENEVANVTMRFIILNFLCSFTETSVIRINLEDQSLGFIIDLGTAPFNNIIFWGGTMREFEWLVSGT